MVAAAGASAALAGLVFVGISLNLERILRFPGLVDRGMETLLDFVVVVVVSLLVLMPEQDVWVSGVLVLVAVVVLRGATALLQRTAWPLMTAYRRSFAVRVAVSLAITTAFLAGALAMAAGAADGIYPVAGAVIMSLLLGVLNAWVLLVEINR